MVLGESAKSPDARVKGFFDCSRATYSQAHSLVISADWNAYDFIIKSRNDGAFCDLLVAL